MKAVGLPLLYLFTVKVVAAMLTDVGLPFVYAYSTFMFQVLLSKAICIICTPKVKQNTPEWLFIPSVPTGTPFHAFPFHVFVDKHI